MTINVLVTGAGGFVGRALVARLRREGRIGDRPLARLTLLDADAFSWFGGQPANSYDLVFADAMPGKFDGFEQLWRLVKPGGLYVIDDLIPQANWPEGHQPRVDALIAALDSRSDARAARLSWASGVVVVAKTTPS